MSRERGPHDVMGPDGRPLRAVVIVARDDLPECWARGWCSERCKARALEVLAQGQLHVPTRWPTMTGN